MAESKGRPGSAGAAAHRRRQGGRHAEEAVFPAQESMPLLRREDRRHQLQGREDAARLRGGAGQDHSPPHFGRVRAAPAAAHGRDQEGAQHRAAAVRGVVLGQEESRHGSHSERRYRKTGQPRRGGQGRRRATPAISCCPRRLAVAATESNKKIVEQERQAHLRKEAKQQGEAQDLAKLLTGVTVTIAQKAGENDQLFGSVTSKDVADALAAQELHHRPPQDPAGRAHQAAGRVQGPGAAA